MTNCSVGFWLFRHRQFLRFALDARRVRPDSLAAMLARRIAPRRTVVISAFCSALLATAAARASDVEVSSSTSAQGYSLRSPFGDPVLMRRRFVQSLGLTVTGIGNDDFDPKGPWISFRMRVRLNADFGVSREETNWANSPGSFVPALALAPVDLMYGYLDVRNLAGGLLSLRLGRQYVVDPLGWWSFDGALVRVELPVHVAIETYGGFEQRGGLPWSTPRFERDGVWRGDRTKLDGTVYPEFQQAHYAPAAGAVIESFSLPVVHARAAYRKVWNTGSAVTLPTPATATSLPPTTNGWRTSSERVGASLDVSDDDLGALRLGSVYDLLTSRFTSHYASADVFVSDRWTLGADADRIVPSFDGDSIWNWFAIDPSTAATARADAQLGRNIDAGMSAGLRWVNVGASANDPAQGAQGTSLDMLSRVHARWRPEHGVIGVSGMLDSGDRGRREGADLYGQHVFEERFLVSARTSLYDWRDDWRPDRSATSFGYVLGGGCRIGDGTQVMLEWEHDTNHLVGQRYRVLALLDMQVMR